MVIRHGSTPPLKIVAHRGATTKAPENTLAAFRRAADLGADAAELDVRLTRERRPVVYHYFYLEEATTGSGPIFEHTAQDLRDVRVVGANGALSDDHRIPTLEEVLEEFSGRMGLEIELKGPEPEAAAIVGALLNTFRSAWETIEVTSFEPTLLVDVQRHCPGIATALLFPRSEDWMRADVVAHSALHRARLAQARIVHLHPTQLTADVVSSVRAGGVEVHAWDVNDEQALRRAVDFGLPWICTDDLERALAFRNGAPETPEIDVRSGG